MEARPGVRELATQMERDDGPDAVIAGQHERDSLHRFRNVLVPVHGPSDGPFLALYCRHANGAPAFPELSYEVQ